MNFRYIIGIEYNGSEYHGWQIQDQAPSVQAEVETALSKIANHPIQVYCAGRTDTGVHALEQVAHFDSPVHREIYTWVIGTNSFLPPQIRILWAKQVDKSFHARYSARLRSYRYIIYNNSVGSAVWHRRATWCYHPLDIDLMQKAANYWIGEHDFSALRASGCQSKSPHRNVKYITVSRDSVDKRFIFIDLGANAFLHHMVRNMVGVLIEIGRKNRPVEWAEQVLLSKDRRQAAVTAPPDGLYLRHVEY